MVGDEAVVGLLMTNNASRAAHFQFVALPRHNTTLSSIANDSCPVRQLPPGRKRTAYLWQCCQCGLSGISIQTQSCPECQQARCASCQTTKVRVRAPRIPGWSMPGVRGDTGTTCGPV
ncbi:hypothetical protein K469DRAFT_193687 [Zopfia rhizophila CBS 207.26]|uniref:Uncharacterized protein n=1 Tax=Zopfia rhizophila CBS 207.26 TaxID=1314779 RepID=A0A6A6ESS1_9PEZI|nr:hypothetical protein K469DRAFT_193687 [Zopfia rhizophila CBS 207.26]